MTLKLQKLYSEAIFPTRAHPDDSGLDIFSPHIICVSAKSTEIIKIGWAASVPRGYEIQIRPKSGLAKKGIVAIFGTVDSNFRGEIGVMIKNETENDYYFEPGDKIAQMVIQKVELWTPEIVQTLDITDRGEGGFGSTGV